MSNEPKSGAAVRPLAVFVSSTVNDLEQERLAVRNLLRDYGFADTSMESFPSGVVVLNEIRKSIDNADLFVGLYGARYGARIPGDPKRRSYIHYELDYAREKSKTLLPFVKRPFKKIEKNAESLRKKVKSMGINVTFFDGVEALQLRVLGTLLEHRVRFISSLIGVRSSSSLPVPPTLKKIFNLGPKPYFMIYGRRVARSGHSVRTPSPKKAREGYSSLYTLNDYSKTYEKSVHDSPTVQVEPEVDSLILKQNGIALLSGPSTSDNSGKYFELLSRKGITMRCFPWVNHFKEKHPDLAKLKIDQPPHSTGFIEVEGHVTRYAFREGCPPIHVALLVRTPSPWAMKENAGPRNGRPITLFAGGCHTQSGFLACRGITSERFMAKLFKKLGYSNGDESPAFVIVLEQIGKAQPQVKFCARVETNSDTRWQLTPIPLS